MKNIVLQRFIIYFGLIFISFGCTIGRKTQDGKTQKWSGYYKLQGSYIPGGCATASVQYFQNQAPLVQPMLAMKLTEALKDKILSDTQLKIVNGNGDVNFEGVIESYGTQPMAPQGGENITAALNRLSVTVKVKYNNSKDQQYDFDFSPITRYIDYSANQTLEDVERNQLDDLVKLLVEDIYNKAFVNW
jgi:hypothetical protein